MSDQAKQQPTDAVEKALRAIVEAIVAQAPVVTDSGMVHVWLDAALLDGAGAALNLKAGAS